MMTLPELVTVYLSERSVSRLYERNMTRLARNVGVLTVQDCNRYLKERLTKVASVTVLYERTMLLVLWRWALDSDLVDLPPKGLVKIKSSRPPTRAWTLDQCCTAVKASFALDSEMMKSGCPLGLFIRCWLLLGYESGARRGDLWRMKASDFSGDTLWWTQHKTGNPCPKILSEECVAAVRDMLSRSPNGTVLSWATCVSGGGKQMRKFLIREKLGGSSKWLRRSSATHIEMEHPGKGRIHLGHKTIGLAEKAYIDWTQVRRDIPQAPRLLKQT
jgi:integrase